MPLLDTLIGCTFGIFHPNSLRQGGRVLLWSLAFALLILAGAPGGTVCRYSAVVHKCAEMLETAQQKFPDLVAYVSPGYTYLGSSEAEEMVGDRMMEPRISGAVTDSTEQSVGGNIRIAGRLGVLRKWMTQVQLLSRSLPALWDQASLQSAFSSFHWSGHFLFHSWAPFGPAPFHSSPFIQSVHCQIQARPVHSSSSMVTEFS